MTTTLIWIKIANIMKVNGYDLHCKRANSKIMTMHTLSLWPGVSVS